jgi:hypothetical protein
MYLLQSEINSRLLYFLRGLEVRCNGSVQHALHNQYKPSRLAIELEEQSGKEYEWLREKMNGLEILYHNRLGGRT